MMVTALMLESPTQLAALLEGAEFALIRFTAKLARGKVRYHLFD